MTQVGERLENLDELIRQSCNQSKIAIIFDWENWWALEDATGPRLDMDYRKTFVQHYRPFWEAGIDVDVVNMDYALDDYDIVIAPLNYLYKKGYAEKVRSFVEAGGTYVTTCWSGIVNETDLCFTDEHPLHEVLGIRQEEIDAPGPEFRNSITYNGKTYETGGLCEIVHNETAKVLAVYEKEFYNGQPVVTENVYGKGKAYYLAAELGLDFLNVFYKELAKAAGIENPLKAELPYGVTVSERKGEKNLIFVQNFKEENVTVEGIGSFTQADTGELIEGKIELAPFECKVLMN